MGSAFQNPSNLYVIESPNLKDVRKILRRSSVSAGHFTNGVYSAPHTLVVPTVLAGFEYIKDNEDKTSEQPGMIIAVNSNASMAITNAKLIAKMKSDIADGLKTSADMDKLQYQIETLEDQDIRARKVITPVALQHSDRPVLAIYYDEETPHELYNGLKYNHFSPENLFKWGYGTNTSEGIVIGAEFFKKTLGLPLPNDKKPVCADITPATGQKGIVTVVDLRGRYISAENKCLFVLPDALAEYSAITPSDRSTPTGPKSTNG